MATLAHELRQPLGAIESIAYYLSMVVPRDDPRVLEQLDRLQELVEQSDWILSNGLHLAGEIVLAPESVDFAELVREFLGSRAWPRPPRLELAANHLRADPHLARALVANLVTLVHASNGVVRTSREIALEVESCSSSLGPGGKLSLESARKIAEAHGGTLESHAGAGGIRIRVMLP